jgi:hypothetical protein
MCRLGNFYNYEEILQKLLNKSNKNVEISDHIRGLKDVVKVNIETGRETNSDYQFVCPLS